MVQSSRTRTKPKQARSKNPIQEVLEKARALDRRRMAQINNQIGTINRLLVDGTYDAEMKILHEGSAALAAENAELREALLQFVRVANSAKDDGLLDGEGLSDAVTRAQELLW